MFRYERPSSEGHINTCGNYYYNVIGHYQCILLVQCHEYKILAFNNYTVVRGHNGGKPVSKSVVCGTSVK
jgi:hypothetical protein